MSDLPIGGHLLVVHESDNNELPAQYARNESGEAFVWAQIAPVLDAAMERLGERERNAVILHFFEAKSLKEVASALGSNVSVPSSTTLTDGTCEPV